MRAVDSIAERYNLSGVYGPLYRLFEVIDHRYNIAAELTAGNRYAFRQNVLKLEQMIPSLFHVVVDTDETASRVLDVMLKEKTGRVTFMPLNRLHPGSPIMPNEADCEPLLEKLRYDSKYDKAFRQIFGKTCVCKDLTIAASYVRSHGINTITLDGDKVDRKGALTGGYHDVRRSRIEGIKNVTTWRAKHEADRKRSDEVKQATSRLEQEITALAGKITILNGQQGQIRDSRDRITEDGMSLNRERERIKERIVKLEMDVDELEMEQHSLITKVKGYQQELASPMLNGLTREEEALIVALGKEVERRKKEILEFSKRRNQVCYHYFCEVLSHLLIQRFIGRKSEERN